MQEAIVWRDGIVAPASKATVPALDSGVLYGDGLFETMRAVGKHIEWLDDHLARMESSASALGIECPARSALAEGVVAAVAAAGVELAGVRLTLTRGTLAAATPRAAASAKSPSWWVMVTPVPDVPPAPVRAVLLAPELLPPHPEHKSLSWQHAVLAQRAAGDLEGIYVNSHGEVTEAISSNVFAVFGDALHTPPIGCCLPGVTRGVLLRNAGRAGLTPIEAPVHLGQLRVADEILLSGSVGRVRSVVELDGQPVGDGRPGPAQTALLAALDSASS